MEKKNEKETIVGIVEEALPNTQFRVSLENGERILTFLSGKMRMYRIRVLVGDKVLIEIDPYGGKGRTGIPQITGRVILAATLGRMIPPQTSIIYTCSPKNNQT